MWAPLLFRLPVPALGKPQICAALGISHATLYHYVKETESTT